MEVRQNLVSSSKHALKCPYSMEANRVVVHNTANDAPAANEIKYMISNDSSTSFHFAVDDVEVVQGIPLNRNSFNAGDGKNGAGNRFGISVEICYSMSGGDRFIKAEQNAAKFIAQLLKERGWGIDKVTKHQDYSGKYCPHRTLDMGWQRFLNMISAELGTAQAPDNPSAPAKKSIETIAQEIIAGQWGNGDDRKNRLKTAGYDYLAVQAIVNELCGVKAPAKPSAPAKKSVDTIAQEVISGQWGNGDDRKNRITAAGYNYSEVQARVNALLRAKPSTLDKKSINIIAREVIRGDWGNGEERKRKLQAAGYDYSVVQTEVNKLC